MPTCIYFIDCGQGNMVLILATNGKVFLCDCNVTDANADRVIAYLKHVLRGRPIDVFICTHRDADHMRGINRIHRAIGIRAIWDCGLPGGNPSSPEGEEYMRMRRAVPNAILRGGTRGDYGATRLHVLSAADDGLPDDCNAQSIVLKVEQIGNPLGTAILTGDSDARTWKRIVERYGYPNKLSAEILLGSHHGSWSFFDIGRDGYHYADHIKAISPAMTVLSVGANVHGHPDPLSLVHYEHYSRGSAAGVRVWRTDQQGTMLLALNDRFGWTLTPHQRVPVPVFRKPQPTVYPPGSLGDIANGPSAAAWRALLSSYTSPRRARTRADQTKALDIDALAFLMGPATTPRVSDFNFPPRAADQATALSGFGLPKPEPKDWFDSFVLGLGKKK